MSPDKLVRMANQIATFFHSKPHDEAVAGVADHISNFWEPRMRAQLFDSAGRRRRGARSACDRGEGSDPSGDGKRLTRRRATSFPNGIFCRKGLNIRC
jgi:hypothetical protein